MKPVQTYLALIATLALFFVSHPSHAENGKGNGGVVRACFRTMAVKNRVQAILLQNMSLPPSSKIDPLTTAVLRDIHEIHLFDFLSPRPMGASLIAAPSTDYKEIVQERLNNLRDTHYLLYGYFADQKNNDIFDTLVHIHRPEFPNALTHLPLDESHWNMANRGVLELGDPGVGVMLPNNCLLLQIANQQRISDRESIVNIDQRLFDLLAQTSPIEAAALYFHEWSINIVDRLLNTPAFQGVSTAALPAQRLTRLIFDRDFTPEIEPSKINQIVRTIGFDFTRKEPGTCPLKALDKLGAYWTMIEGDPTCSYWYEKFLLKNSRHHEKFGFTDEVGLVKKSSIFIIDEVRFLTYDPSQDSFRTQSLINISGESFYLDGWAKVTMLEGTPHIKWMNAIPKEYFIISKIILCEDGRQLKSTNSADSDGFGIWVEYSPEKNRLTLHSNQGGRRTEDKNTYCR